MTQRLDVAGARTQPSEATLPGAWQLGLARGGVEVKAFFRDKMAVAFIFGLPPILLVLLGSIFGSQAAAQGVTVGQLFTAGMICTCPPRPDGGGRSPGCSCSAAPPARCSASRPAAYRGRRRAPCR